MPSVKATAKPSKGVKRKSQDAPRPYVPRDSNKKAKKDTSKREIEKAVVAEPAASGSKSPEESEEEEATWGGIQAAATEKEDEEIQLEEYSSDDDSSDDEVVDESNNLDIGKLPTIAKDDATVKRKLEKAKKRPTEDRGVIYIGRLPHGFYEDQLKGYFTQFGDITRLRVSRNKKTGKSKHYAFLEFESSEVAQIVAETMDNYLMMGHILRCKVIPKDQVHAELWIGANRKWRVVPRARVTRVAHNKLRTEADQKKAEKRLLKRQAQRKQKLQAAGINYDISAVSYKK